MSFHEVTIGPCRLILGDCMDVLPTLGRVDAVVTDPPYGIGARMQGGTWGAANKYADFRDWDVAPSQDEIRKVIEAGSIAVVWGGNHFSLPPSRGWFIWDKQNAVQTMADVELAWSNIDRPAKRFSHPVATHRWGHPSEKPEPLMVWCLSLIDGHSVLDPFMGSGTTGVACIRLDRKFIGVEKSPRYFSTACKRITRAWQDKQSELKFDPPPIETQAELF